MPVSGERVITGPKTFEIACPSLAVFGTTLVAQNTVTVNTAPRAAQSWEILSAAYKFPEATRNNENVLTGLNLQFEFNIGMLIGGITIAEQEFLESARSNEPKIESGISMHLLGSLEPFAPGTVYPGQSLSFLYSLSKNAVSTTAASTGTGIIVIQYNLITHRRGGSR